LLNLDNRFCIRISVGIQGNERIASAYRVSHLTSRREACGANEGECLVACLSLIGVNQTKIDEIALCKGEISNVISTSR
jgi:hypothetical protein